MVSWASCRCMIQTWRRSSTACNSSWPRGSMTSAAQLQGLCPGEQSQLYAVGIVAWAGSAAGRACSSSWPRRSVASAAPLHGLGPLRERAFTQRNPISGLHTCGFGCGLLMCRWQAVKPKGGPAGNPSVVLVQLDDATRQLQDLQEEAEQLAKVGPALQFTPLICVPGSWPSTYSCLHG